MNDGGTERTAAKAPPEQVVLLDEDHRPVGTADKASVHTAHTPLHLAFSCHVFNERGEVLVTRRALAKATWPGVWTNAFCGHPAPGESLEDAVRRRAGWELGIAVDSVAMVLPEFRYRATDASGIVENEFCPVFTAVTRQEPQPRADEVGEFQWVAPADLEAAVSSAPWAFSPWLVLQLDQFRLTERQDR